MDGCFRRMNGKRAGPEKAGPLASDLSNKTAYWSFVAQNRTV